MVKSPVLVKTLRLLAAVAVLLPSLVCAEIYDKRELKPWFSFSGQATFQKADGINDAVFGRVQETFGDTILDYYEGFDSWVPPNIGLAFGAGVEYDRLTIGFDVGFSVPTTSEKPSGITNPYVADSAEVHYRDASYYFVYIDFTCGWMLAAPGAPLNLIPMVRAGFSLLNVVYPGDYPYQSKDGNLTNYRLRSRYYTTAGRSIAPELELRLRTSLHTRLGLYAGYRFTWIDQVFLETDDGTAYFPENSPTDVDASDAYVGLRFTVVLQSEKEKARDFSKED